MSRFAALSILAAFLALTTLGASLPLLTTTAPTGTPGGWTTHVPPGAAVFDATTTTSVSVPEIRADASVPVFGGEVRMPGVRVGEPAAKAAPDGTLYVYAPGYLAVSTNGGAAWNSVNLRGRLGPVECGCDSDAAIDGNNNLQYSDLVYPTAISVGFTPDKGKDWVSNDMSSLTDHGMDRQWIESDGKTTTYLTYRIGFQIYLATSVAGPTPTFLPSIPSNAEGSNFRAGYLAVDRNANVAYLFYTSGNSVRVDVATAFGQVVTDLKVADTGDNNDAFASGAVDDAGNVYVLWNSKEVVNGALVTSSYYAYSTDQAQHFSAPIKLNQAPRTTVFPWAVGGKDGVLGVVYYGSADAHEPSLVTGDWFAYYNYITNAHSASPTMSENLVVPHRVKDGPICTFGTGCGSRDRSFLDYFGVHKTSDGRAIMAFNDRETQALGAAPYIHFVQQVDGPRLE